MMELFIYSHLFKNFSDHTQKGQVQGLSAAYIWSLPLSFQWHPQEQGNHVNTGSTPPNTILTAMFHTHHSVREDSSSHCSHPGKRRLGKSLGSNNKQCHQADVRRTGSGTDQSSMVQITSHLWAWIPHPQGYRWSGRINYDSEIKGCDIYCIGPITKQVPNRYLLNVKRMMNSSVWSLS